MAKTKRLVLTSRRISLSSKSQRPFAGHALAARAVVRTWKQPLLQHDQDQSVTIVAEQSRRHAVGK